MPQPTRDPEPLTEREREILKLVAEAHTNEQIAELLTISPRTVERHRDNIMGKLGMRDRVQLTRDAIRRGLVEHLATQRWVSAPMEGTIRPSHHRST